MFLLAALRSYPEAVECIMHYIRFRTVAQSAEGSFANYVTVIASLALLALRSSYSGLCRLCNWCAMFYIRQVVFQSLSVVCPLLYFNILQFFVRINVVINLSIEVIIY